MKMRMKRTLSTQKEDNFNLGETKKKINNYFSYLETLQWEQAKLNADKGLTANYDLSPKQKQQPYIWIGRDEFNLLAKAEKDEELKKLISGFYWAQSILSEQEQIYILEYFVNGKYEKELLNLLGFNSLDSREFRKLKRRAIYKFAYVLNLLV